MSNYLIDTHCHINDLPEENLSSLLSRAEDSRIGKMICIGASKGTNSSLESYALAERFTQVYCSIGIHPHDADSYNWDTPLLDLVSKPKVVGIGETGLDYFKEWSDFSKQESLFRKTISIAKEVKKPLVIHCRDAFSECLRILKETNAKEVGGVFHCFSGTAEEAKQLSDINFLVSYTGILTFKNAHRIRTEAAMIPLEQIMLETDSPYMAPEPYRGKQSEPAHVALIAQTLAETHQVPVETVIEVTTYNALKLFPGLSA